MVTTWYRENLLIFVQSMHFQQLSACDIRNTRFETSEVGYKKRIHRHQLYNSFGENQILTATATTKMKNCLDSVLYNPGFVSLIHVGESVEN